MPEKFRWRRRRFLISIAGIAGIAALASFVLSRRPGQYVEAEDVVSEGNGAHIVIQSPHSDDLYWGAVSPDLRTALTGSRRSLKLWDVPSGHLLRTLSDLASKPGSADWTKAVAFSPDGQSALTKDGRESKYVLWDVASGHALWTLKGGAAGGPFRFSADGRRLLSGDRQGAVTLREVASGRTIRSFKGHSESVTAVAFDADGRSALSAAGSEVRRWDIPSGLERNIFKGNFGSVEDLAVLPKGYSALSTQSGNTDETVTVWNVETGGERAAFTSSNSDGPRLSALSPDGGTVLSANRSSVERFDVASGLKTGSVAGDFGTGYQLAFPSSIEASSSAGVLVSSGMTVRRGEGPGGSDSREWGSRVEIWDFAAERRLASFGKQFQGVSFLNFSRDGHVAVSGHVGGVLNLWDMRSGRRLATFREDFKEPNEKCRTFYEYGIDSPCTTAAAASPDNRGVLAAGSDRTVNFWNAENAGANWRQGGGAAQVQVLAFSPDGHRALSGNAYGIVSLWDCTTGQKIRDFAGHYNPINALAFLPDGVHALSADPKGMLVLWDLTTGQELRSFNGFSRSIAAMAVAPDGASALSGGNDGEVTLWDLRKGEELRTFSGHSGERIIAVAFSPDGHTALSAGADGTVNAWDIAAARTFWGRMVWAAFHSLHVWMDRLVGCGAVKGGGELRTLSGYPGDPMPDRSRSWEGRLAFSPDGRTMLTGGADGSLRLWDHVTGKALATLLFSPDGSWLTITPEGFYDSSSPEKVKEFAVVRGRDVCSDRSVHDTLYRPDLVAEKIAGDKEGKVSAAAAGLNLDKACFDQRP